MTWEQYRAELEGNLEDLHARLHRGAYRAKPSRRVFIGPRPTVGNDRSELRRWRTRLSSAVVEVLNAIYEVDFLGFSYGFRPGRGQHQALDALSVGLACKKALYFSKTRGSRTEKMGGSHREYWG
ncbi:MAG: hypothetical protein V3V08_06625 [Nannocystaceae bacterium]